MRIAMLTNNYKPFIGGVPISIERLSEGLRALGHEVYIFAPTYNNQSEEPYVIRYGAFNKGLDNGGVIPYPFDVTLEKAFKSLSFDIIHVHHPNFIGWTAQYLGKKYKIPVVYTYHTRYEQYLHHVKPFKKLETVSLDQLHPLQSLSTHTLNYCKNTLVPSAIKRYANKCDGIFAPTSMMEDLLTDMGISTSVKILPTGINNQFFKANPQTVTEIKSQYQQHKKHLFCTVSRLDAEKNIEFLIDGIYNFKNKFGDDFRLMIIGDGPLRSALEEKISTLDLTNEVVLLKSIPNTLIHNYYAASDLFLFASKSETQGIVLLESMASKTPVIAIEASGVVEVVKNGINGYMTEDNIDAWSDTIIKALEDSDHLNELKEGSYRTSLNYTTTSVAQSAYQYYTQFIASHIYKNTKPNSTTHHLKGGIYGQI